MEKYRAVVVADDKENGILFAKRSNSLLMTDHIIFDDITKNMTSLLDDDGTVTLKNYRDGFDEWVTEAKFFDDGGKLISTIEYKVCFDDEKENVDE